MTLEGLTFDSFGSRRSGPRAVHLGPGVAAWTVILLACLGAFAVAEAPAGPAPTQDDSKRRRPKKRDDRLPSVRMSGSGYVRSLLDLDPQTMTVNGLSVKVSVVPDAYRYFMAEGIEELEEDGYAGAELDAKIRKLRGKHGRKKNKMLFFVSWTIRGGENYCFLTKTLRSHLRLEQGGSERTFSVEGVDPKPDVEQWIIFQYPTGGLRRSRKKLGMANEIRFRVLSGSAKASKREPIELSLVNLVIQGRSPDPKDSINRDQNQMSIRKWDDVTVKKKTLKFRPGRWRIPEPPDGFEELLKQLR